MENKELKSKEVKQEEVKKEEGVIIEKELDPKKLIIQNEELKAIINKEFKSLSREEKEKLPKAKLKIITRKNQFTGIKTHTARVILSEGIYLDKILSAEEHTLLRRYRPELFEKQDVNQPKPSALIPIKLWCQKNKEGSYNYRFNAELCPGVYGRLKNRSGSWINYINEKQIQLLLIDDTTYRFVETEYEVKTEENYDEYEDM